MGERVLKNSPLTEAYFEMRWVLIGAGQAELIQSSYDVMLEHLINVIKDAYPYHNELPLASLPAGLTMYFIQHQFRKGRNKWPMIQIGPGIVTLNTAEKYSWLDFEERILQLFDAIADGYSNTGFELKPNWFVLRYTSGVELDRKDITAFLSQNFRMNVNVDEKIFKGTNVGSLPLGADLKFFFPCDKPKGTVNLRFGQGKKNEKETIFWEVEMLKEYGVLKDRRKIVEWCEQSHEILEHVFFNMLQEEFLARFES
ncbi:MAG: TIGR04255 family protein [Fervidobacterium sp.]